LTAADIVVLTGRRRTGPTPAEATIKLYHNNRDGPSACDRRSGWDDVSAAGITVADATTTASRHSSSPAGGRTTVPARATARTRGDHAAGLLHGVRYGTGCT
jgi:hypothetical protein